jgi:hypothetical protein
VLGVIAGDERSLQLAAAGWAHLNRLRVPPWRWRVGFEAGGIRVHRSWATIEQASRYAPVGVLHLIGRVEDRSHGLAFVTQTGSDESTSRRSLRPGDVIDRYPLVQMIVLQPEPYDRWPDERYPSDREAMSRLRLFAAELSADGVPFVLILPALDTAYAARVLALLARLLNVNAMPPVRALARTVLRIQRLVSAHAGSAMVATETCCDATLFHCRTSRTESELPPISRSRPTEKAAPPPPPAESFQRRLRKS